MDRLSSAIRCKNIRGNLCASFTLHAHRLTITFLFNIFKNVHKVKDRQKTLSMQPTDFHYK